MNAKEILILTSRDGETRDVSRTKMNMWMGQACASGAIQTNHGTVERMRGLLRCMAMACFVETNCDTRDEIWPIGTVLNS